MYLYELVDVINGDFTVGDLAIKNGVEREAVELAIRSYFDMTPKELLAEYRKQTNARAIDLHRVHVTREFSSDGDREHVFVDKTHHATTESKLLAAGHWCAKFEVVSPVIEVLVCDSTDRYPRALSYKAYVDLSKLESSKRDNRLTYTTTVDVLTTKDEPHRLEITVHDFRKDPLDLFNVTVEFGSESLARLDQGLVAKAYVSKNTMFFTPKFESSHAEDTTMSTKNGTDVQKVAEMLVNTDSNVRDILDTVGITDQPKFYGDFRQRYHCTPSEYRRKERDARKAVEASKVAEHKDEPWDFTVTLYPEGQPNYGNHNQSPMNESQRVSITVNECYVFVVHLITTQGHCPYREVKDLMRGEHREMLNDLVIEVLQPYFHGRLDIAYGMSFYDPRAWSAPSMPSPVSGMVRR